MENLKNVIPKNSNNDNITDLINPEKYNLIKQTLKILKKKKKILQPKIVSGNLLSIIIILILLLILFYFNNYIIINEYKNMMPRLTPDINAKPPSSITEVFNSRQIYIKDIKITPEYLRYIRPINKKEEAKFKIRYSNTTTYISKKMFARRPDQYGYKRFCQLALAEKLIDNSTIEYNNTPDISVVMPSYNKKNILLKSIRSIQNQNFKNIEIIIVNDCSTDNSTDLFNYLLKTDSRIRIFHHMKNMGCWRSRLDGIIYSKGKYIILFDAGDLYQDNYVLQNAYDIMEKYRLDSCKFLFRIIRSFKKLGRSQVFFHVGRKSKIVYGSGNIYKHNRRVFSYWGNIWNRLVRANVYIKGLFEYNKLMLNLYKNVHDDVWCNRMVNRNSFSYAIFERVGYVYLQNGQGEGSPKSRTKRQKSKLMAEFIGILYYRYNFAPKKHNKTHIIKQLSKFNRKYHGLSLKNMIGRFNVLNDLLEALIEDPGVTSNDKKYLQILLKESKEREKKIKK